MLPRDKEGYRHLMNGRDYHGWARVSLGIFMCGEGQVYEFSVIFSFWLFLNMKLKINILRIVNFNKLTCENGNQTSNTHSERKLQTRVQATVRKWLT